MHSKPIHRPLALATLLIALGACGSSTHTEAPPSQGTSAPALGPEGEELFDAELTTVGWDQLSRSPVVLLRASETGQVVPIWIGVAEAQAIQAALYGIEFPRPMTHDLTVNLLAELGAELEEVVVHDIRDGTYYGLLKLRIEGEEAPHWVDTRPSDGMALAMRTGAAIRLTRKILDDLPEYDFLAPEGAEQVVRVLGMTVLAATPELRGRYELPDRPGLVVTSVEDAAEDAGLRRGDLIVEIAGETPREPLDLLEALRELGPGDTLPLTYWRDGEETEIEVEVGIEDKLPKSDQVA